MLRLLIVANVRLYREELDRCLSKVPVIEVVGTASTRRGVLRRLADGADVVLVDMATPDSLSIIEVVHRDFPSAKVVALGLPEIEDVIIPCAEAGVVGYLPPEGSMDELTDLLARVARGEALVSPRIAGGLLRRVSALAALRMETGSGVQLTPREREIAALLERGFSNKRISRRLNIQVATVKNHVHSILKKLQIHSRAQVPERLRAERRLRFGPGDARGSDALDARKESGPDVSAVRSLNRMGARGL